MTVTVIDFRAIAHELGKQGPPRWIDTGGVNGWLISRHDEVRTCLAHPSMSPPTAYAVGLGVTSPMSGLFEDTVLGSDPPRHTRLRRLLARDFTVRRVEALRPRVQEVTDELLDAMTPNGHADLVSEFAVPIPVRVICELLGVPYGDRADFIAWTDNMLSRREGAAAAAEKLWAYVEDLVEAKTADPGDDLISALVSAHADDRLSHKEVVAGVRVILVAGYETTSSFIGNAMLALLTHPDQLDALRRGPELIKPAVEELLRFTGPGVFNLRYATQDLELGDIRIRAGERVILDLDAANADPAVFGERPGLDVRRDAAGHVQFGHGIHHCVGAPLARLEGQVAIASIIRRFPGLSLTRVSEFRTDSTLRMLGELPVEF